MTPRFLAAMILVALYIQGCATKEYGRQPSLTDYEKSAMSCSDIDREMAKVIGFAEKVKTSEASDKWYDVSATFSKYWIGNNLEKGAALESANVRIIDLWSLRDAKKCNGGVGSEPLSLPVQRPVVEERF